MRFHRGIAALGVCPLGRELPRGDENRMHSDEFCQFLEFGEQRALELRGILFGTINAAR